MTKQEIKNSTITRKGHLAYSHRTNININDDCITFEKPMGEVTIYITRLNKNFQPYTEVIGYCDDKKEYINEIYSWIEINYI